MLCFGFTPSLDTVAVENSELYEQVRKKVRERLFTVHSKTVHEWISLLQANRYQKHYESLLV